MDAPRSSSNGILTIVCLGILALCGYKLYQDHLERERLAELSRIAKSTPRPATPRATPPPPKPIEYAITASRQIEPYYIQLFADLDRNNPIDLVPPITIVRERVLDKHATASKEKQVVYEFATKLLDGMTAAAEERTQALESLLKTAAQPRTALDASRNTGTSNQIFLEAQTKRLREALMRRKPAVDNLFAQLRNAERQWNIRLPNDSPLEMYDIGAFAPAIITADVETRSNPLEQRAYDRRTIYPWRRSYYEQYGYPRNYVR
jgi:hypothetical protein